MASDGVDYQNGNGADIGTSKAVSFSSLRPKLVVQAPRAAEAVAFYKAAFGAEEVLRVNHPKRKADQELPLILYSHLRLGAVELLVSDETDDSEAGVKSTDGLGGTPLLLCLETDDVEPAVAKAVQAGAVADEGAADGTCCGGCWTKVKDPFGFVWAIGSSSKATPIGPDEA